MTVEGELIKIVFNWEKLTLLLRGSGEKQLSMLMSDFVRKFAGSSQAQRFLDLKKPQVFEVSLVSMLDEWMPRAFDPKAFRFIDKEFTQAEDEEEAATRSARTPRSTTLSRTSRRATGRRRASRS